MNEFRRTAKIRAAGRSSVVPSSSREVDERTADRAVPASPRQRLARLMEKSAAAREVAELAREIYTPNGLDRFLSTPMAVFDGRTALDLLERDEAEPVLAALAADYEGLGF